MTIYIEFDILKDKDMKPKALILDESDSNILKDALTAAGFMIDLTPGEIEALEKINSGSFSLFFVSINGIERLEVIKRALEIDSSLSVVAMTDLPTVEMAVQCLKAGVYEYLVKPINKDRLKFIIDTATAKDGNSERDQKEFYKQLAITDGLTGLYNQRYFHEILSREIERARRYPQPVSLLMADLDDFKRYNDLYGHQAGDMVLKIVANSIARQVRQVDLVARYGGEEFAIILPNATKQTAHTLASRIRCSIAQITIDAEGHFPKRLTISIGLAGFPDEAKTKDELIARADKALYRAKAAGRNRVFAFW